MRELSSPAEPDAWVEPPIQHIHHQSHPDEQRRINDDHAHHQGVIAIQ